MKSEKNGTYQPMIEINEDGEIEVIYYYHAKHSKEAIKENKTIELTQKNHLL